jgi:hypothetical protein
MYLAMFQRWGQLVELLQSVVVYILVIINVFVFCWFGSELNDQESIITK